MFMCRHCLLADERETPCPRCGRLRVRCEPGEPGSPECRPLIDAAGQVRTRAPRWWIRHTMAEFARFLDAV
jgi:hypothetical protein